jgi:hypothetical protein
MARSWSRSSAKLKKTPSDLHYLEQMIDLLRPVTRFLEAVHLEKEEAGSAKQTGL